jgi:hypothetical protein
LATQTRAPQKNQALQNQLTARVLRQPMTAVHASLAQQKPAHLHHAGKIALRAPSTVMHARLVTHVTHVMLDQLLVATSVATGAQHLLHAAATFSAMTVTHVRLVTTVPRELSIATHVRLVMTVPRELSTVTHVRPASSKIVQPEPLTVTHAQRVTIVHHALSTVTHVRLVTIVHHALSIVTHAQRATHAMVVHVQPLALSTEQIHAAHASSMTAHASSTATTATTAPTVVQTALTVLTAIVTATALLMAHARATQTRRPSSKTRSLSV